MHDLTYNEGRKHTGNIISIRELGGYKMAEEIYKRLAQALNSPGVLLPAILCDEFCALARELFTPEQAEIACDMPMKPVTVEDLAKQLLRADVKQLSEQIEGMADKGLVRVDIRGGERFYELLPLVPGILELQFLSGKVNEHTKRVALLYLQYVKATTGQKRVAPHTTEPTHGPRRVVSVNKAFEHHVTILPYDETMKLINAADYIAAGTCMCRHVGDLVDKSCSKPKTDMCIYFGSFAKFAVSRGFARLFSKEEARQRIDEADKAGLVHNFSNTNDRYVDVLCNCCGCHCGVLKVLNHSPSPSNSCIANWVVMVDDGACTGCGACVDRCWMSALKMTGTVATRDANRCIGCGVCMPECPTDALRLEHREAVAIR